MPLVTLRKPMPTRPWRKRSSNTCRVGTQTERIEVMFKTLSLGFVLFVGHQGAWAGVDPSSGNYSTEFNDVKISGGLTVRLDRIYNSLNGGGKNGFFGPGWSSN